MSSSTASPQQKQIRLQKPADWTVWLSFVRWIAQGDKIWNLVDPSLPTKPENLEEPVAPEFDDSGDIDLQKYEKHKARKGLYKERLAKYEKQNDAFKTLTRHIGSTLSAEAAVLVADENAHPYDILRTLKLRYAPDDQAAKIQIETKYKSLCMGSGNQDIEKWLDDWQRTYATGRTLKVKEMEDERPIRDFIYSLMKTDNGWANAHLAVINMTVTESSLFNLISEFRNHTRLTASVDLKHNTHAAFAADQNQNKNQNQHNSERGRGGYRGRGRGNGRGNFGTSFRGQYQSSECLCGLVHWYSECAYLNPLSRSFNWQPDSEISRKVTEAMKNPDTKSRIEYSIKKRRDMMTQRQQQQDQNKSGASSSKSAFAAGQQQQQNQQQSDESSNYEYYGAFATAVNHAAFAVASYPLQSSWILDNGSDAHICNKTMLHRFRKTRDAQPGGVLAGETNSNIEAFGEVQINIPALGGTIWKVTLKEVCYIPNFMTNVVSGTILREKGVRFDDGQMRLHANGKTLGLVKHVHRKDVLEDNTTIKNDDYFGSALAVAKSGTAVEWHRLLAHANDEIIQHLHAAAEGVKITGGTAPKTHECEVCALSKMHRIVSRSTYIEEISPTNSPFFRISYDLIPMIKALNGHQWISHFACMSHDFNIIYTHRSKSEAQQIVPQAIKLISNRFNAKVVFLRSDGERTLGSQFRDFISNMGITYEPSAPDTPDQNGHSEKKGHLICMKARALRIEANLFEYLWPWIVQTTDYLMNRTPMKKHGWKTSHEVIFNRKPHLGHLRKIGCKAYSLDKNIVQSRKMQERAHIGHLLGYEGTNIFLI